MVTRAPGVIGSNEGIRSHREHKSIRQDTPAILLCHTMVILMAETRSAIPVAKPLTVPPRKV